MAIWIVLLSVFGADPAPESFRNVSYSFALLPEQYRATSQDTSSLWDDLAQTCQRYEDLVAPIAIVSGTADTTVPDYNHSDKFIEKFPETHSIYIEGACHQLHHTHSEQTLSALLWLSEQ